MKKYLVILMLLMPITAQANDDPCVPDSINAEVEVRYTDLFKSTEGIEMLHKVNKRIDTGDINKDGAKILLKKELEMTIRKEHDCAVSYNMKDKLKEVEAMEKAEEEALRTACAPDLYVIKSRAKYEAYKTDPAYADFEKQVYEQVTKDTPSTALKTFDKNWENSEMRKNVVIAVFDMGLREADECSNAAVPVSNVILEMLKEE